MSACKLLAMLHIKELPWEPISKLGVWLNHTVSNWHKTPHHGLTELSSPELSRPNSHSASLCARCVSASLCCFLDAVPGSFSSGLFCVFFPFPCIFDVFSFLVGDLVVADFLFFVGLFCLQSSFDCFSSSFLLSVESTLHQFQYCKYALLDSLQTKEFPTTNALSLSLSLSLFLSL